MNIRMRFLGVLCLALVLVPSSPVEAQRERETGFMVHQFNICPDENLAEVNRLSAVAVPILEELREEGMIRAWYDVRHAWGDEWNVGFITIADGHRAWLDFWSEYVSRVNERHPGMMGEFVGLCTLHKDNFYSIRDSGPGGA